MNEEVYCIEVKNFCNIGIWYVVDFDEFIIFIVIFFMFYLISCMM